MERAFRRFPDALLPARVGRGNRPGTWRGAEQDFATRVERRPTLPPAVGGHTCERVPPAPTWHTCTSYVSTVKFKIFTAGKIAAVARTRTRTSPCWLGAVGFSGSRRPTAARGSLRARACAQRAPARSAARTHPPRAPRACRPSCRMRMERRSVNPRCGRVEVYPKSNPQQRGHSLLISHLLLPSVEGAHEYNHIHCAALTDRPTGGAACVCHRVCVAPGPSGAG